jgi:hypothetical protein
MHGASMPFTTTAILERLGATPEQIDRGRRRVPDELSA